MFFYLKISCKDKSILEKFLRFLTKMNFLPVSVKSFPKHEKRKFVTVLKSPHVNKTAQEQFEFRLYSKHILIRSFKPLTFFLLLKTLKNSSFTGLNLEIKGFLEKTKMYLYVLKIVSPDIIVFKSRNNSNLNSKPYKKNLKKISTKYTNNFSLCKKYIQLFDLYGEICLTKAFYS
jgi:ribosomal protein S10